MEIKETDSTQKRASLSRRTFLTLSTGTAAALMLGTTRWKAPETVKDALRRLSLPIPPLMTGTAQNGVVTYDLTAKPGTMEFLPGLQTATWGYNGAYLGPTLMLRKGDQVMLRVTNDIGVTTTTHWHGMHVPASLGVSNGQWSIVNCQWLTGRLINH